MTRLAREEAECALDLARSIVASSTAVETEVTVERVRDRFVRFADVGPTQSADRERVEVAVRVRVPGPGGRALGEARAACGSLDPDDVRAALARATAIARAMTPNLGLLPLGGPVDVATARVDPATRDHPFAAKAEWIERALVACRAHDLAPAGLAQTTVVERAIANSAGRAVEGATARAAFALTAGSGGATGFAEAIAGSVGALDARAVVERAIAKALAARAAVPIAPGEYTVVLEPAAVSSLLLFLGYQGFGAQAFEERSSFLCGRIDEPLFSEHLSIVDDASNPHYSGFAFDGEGTPRRRTLLVERGRVRGPVTDRGSAARLGLGNTGHAAPQPSAEGARPSNLVVLPGRTTQDELVRGVERGLLVSQLHYVNLIEPRELVLTGTTRHGTYSIEDGEVRGAVGDLRFTESLVAALGARTTGVGNALEVHGALFEGELVAPALRIERFRFTSEVEGG